MALNQQTYLEKVILFLSKLRDETGFNLENPLDRDSRIKLAALANSALSSGEPEIKHLIDRALATDDAPTQEILLYTGIGKGPLSPEGINSVIGVASNKLKGLGVNPDDVLKKLEPEKEEEEVEISTFGDEFTSVNDLFGSEEEEKATSEPEEEEEQSLDALLASDEEPEEEPEAEEKPMGDKDDGSGERVAKEGSEDEDAEEAYEEEPQPLNDWFMRFSLN